MVKTLLEEKNKEEKAQSSIQNKSVDNKVSCNENSNEVKILVILGKKNKKWK